MSSTLYLLRQRPEQISPALFLAGEADIDIVLVEEASSIAPSSIKETVIATDRIKIDGSRPISTYDDLIHKIFSSDHIIVL